MLSMFRVAFHCRAVRIATAAVLLTVSAIVAAPVSAQNANAGYEWFWREVPVRADLGAREHALLIVQDRIDSRGFSARALERTENTVQRWRDQIEVAAHAARISEALIAAIVTVESSGHASAVSPVGAQGLGQLMPGTALALGVRDSLNPMENLRGAALYISDLIDLFEGDLVLALAGYNAGEGAVIRHKGVPPYAETRAYVPKVLEAYEAARRLCVGAPPAHVRGVCILPRPL